MPLKTDTAKKAYSYTRMSSLAQLKGDSKRRQKDAVSKWVSEHNLELVGIYDDEGKSAYSGKHTSSGKLGVFIDDLKSGKITKGSILLVESLDRLSREEANKALAQFNEMISYGVEIHNISRNQIYNQNRLQKDPWILIESLVTMIRANEESETKSMRLKSSWHNKRENIDKKILTSICPAWLRPTEDKVQFLPIPERVETVKTIFSKYLDGEGVHRISVFLNQNPDQYPPFGSRKKQRLSERPKWHKSYVTKILKNPSVYGYFQPQTKTRGERKPTSKDYANYYPEVIDKETFYAVKAKLQQKLGKGGGRKDEQFKNIFSKMLICGNCGGSVNYFDKGKPPKGGRYLRCSKSVVKDSCDCPGWRYEEFEESFFTFASEVDLKGILDNDVNESQIRSLKTRLASIDSNISDLEEKLDSLVDLVLSPSTRAKIVQRMEDCSFEIDALKKQRSDIQNYISNLATTAKALSKAEIKKIITDLRLKNDQEAISDRKNLHHSLTDLIEKIVLFNKKIDFIPPEAFQFLPSASRDFLKKKGVSAEEIEVYFSDEGTHAEFHSLRRHFTIHFKNGSLRTVTPAADWSGLLGYNPKQDFADFKQKQEIAEINSWEAPITTLQAGPIEIERPDVSSEET